MTDVNIGLQYTQWPASQLGALHLGIPKALQTTSAAGVRGRSKPLTAASKRGQRECPFLSSSPIRFAALASYESRNAPASPLVSKHRRPLSSHEAQSPKSTGSLPAFKLFSNLSSAPSRTARLAERARFKFSAGAVSDAASLHFFCLSDF